MAHTWQRYTGNTVALARMEKGCCPECGQSIDLHGGRGGPDCSLTDNGVAGRIHQYKQDKESQQ